MAMINGFDMNSDFTSFMVVTMIVLMAFAIALARVAPMRQKKGGRGAKKINDRFSDRNGELID